MRSKAKLKMEELLPLKVYPFTLLLENNHISLKYSVIFQENFEEAFEDLKLVIDDYREAVRSS